jgi:hypothetical protein
MGIPIMDNARRVLDAYNEGMISGIIILLKNRYPKISNKKLKNNITKILDLDKNYLEYWFEWFELN